MVCPLFFDARNSIQSSRERSLEKGRARFRALIENSGGLLTESEVADLTGKSPDVVREWAGAYEVITIPDEDGSIHYPAFQFDEDGPIEGVREIIHILRESLRIKGSGHVTFCTFLLAPNVDIQGMTNLSALSHETYRPLVFRDARQLGIQGAR